jgi:hypothetical protein
MTSALLLVGVMLGIALWPFVCDWPDTEADWSSVPVIPFHSLAVKPQNVVPEKFTVMLVEAEADTTPFHISAWGVELAVDSATFVHVTLVCVIDETFVDPSASMHAIRRFPLVGVLGHVAA